MFIIFLLSPFREELYPWYFIWVFVFLVLTPERKNLLLLGISLSFSLLLRYVPFMLTGTYFNMTPFLKILLTLSVPVLVSIYLLLRRVWLKHIVHFL
jgi:hypothetical protein